MPVYLQQVVRMSLTARALCTHRLTASQGRHSGSRHPARQRKWKQQQEQPSDCEPLDKENSAIKAEWAGRFTW